MIDKTESSIPTRMGPLPNTHNPNLHNDDDDDEAGDSAKNTLEEHQR